MTIDAWLPAAISGTLSGLLACIGGFMAVRVSLAKMEVRQDAAEKLADERHAENQRRLLALEMEQREATRREMREASGPMRELVAVLKHQGSG